jgi:hypothetical protein
LLGERLTLDVARGFIARRDSITIEVAAALLLSASQVLGVDEHRLAEVLLEPSQGVEAE